MAVVSTTVYSLLLNMSHRKELFRETWSSDRKYLIRAYAKVVAQPGITRVFTAIAFVQVFEGDPKITPPRELFFSASELNAHDLLDELQNAERIGRDFIAGISPREPGF